MEHTVVWQWKAFANWVREVLLAQYVPARGGAVLDIAPVPRGVDGGKLARCGLARYVALTRYPEAAQEAAACAARRGVAHTAAVGGVALADELLDPREHAALAPHTFDTVLALDPGGVVSAAFRDETAARVLVHNVARCLRVGGVFCGIVPDSSELFRLASKAQMREDAATAAAAATRGGGDTNGSGTSVAAAVPGACLLPPIRGELYRLSFSAGAFEPFGTEYVLRIGEGECVQGALVHTPSLLAVARSVGLQPVELRNFRDVYDEHHAHYADRIAAANLQQLHHSQLEVIGLCRPLSSCLLPTPFPPSLTHVCVCVCVGALGDRPVHHVCVCQDGRRRAHVGAALLATNPAEPKKRDKGGGERDCGDCGGNHQVAAACKQRVCAVTPSPRWGRTGRPLRGSRSPPLTVAVAVVAVVAVAMGVLALQATVVAVAMGALALQAVEVVARASVGAVEQDPQEVGAAQGRQTRG